MLQKILRRINQYLIKQFQTLDQRQKRSLGFFISGLLLISICMIWRLQQPANLSFNLDFPESTNSTSDNLTSKPVRIHIPKVNLDLNIEETSIIDGIWQVSATSASHLSQSANPGESNNIVIYGHNKTNLFGPIRWLEIGDIIEIANEQNNLYLYTITQVINTTSDDIQYVLPQEEETLTLYTCTDFLDKKRHLIIAKPQVENNH